MKEIVEQLVSSLGRKIAVAVAAVSLIAGTTFVFFAHKTGYTILEYEVQTKAHGIAELLSGLLDHMMLEGRGAHVQEMLESATKSNDIVDVFIVREDGSIAFRAKSDNTVTRLPLEYFQSISGSHEEKFLSTREGASLFEYVLTPIVAKPQCKSCHTKPEQVRGYFAMKIAMDDVRSAALEHRTVNIVMTILTFGGLGFITFFALSVLVIRPIGKLHSHIRRIEGGVKRLESGEETHFPLLPEPDTRDEIGDLCRDFNSLLRRLNEANAKLYDLHQVQLEHADRLSTTGEMAAGIAHEIKNPIAGVLGALQVFESETKEDDSRKEILVEMMSQLERVNHAVNDLLSYARPSPPRFEEVDVPELIRKTVSLLSPQAKGKHVAIEITSELSNNLIAADRKQVQQVLWNVILNGVQAMETSGVVKVHSSQANTSVKISVSDSGKGIPRDHLDRVFKPFFTSKHKGTGLGMTVSKRIVDQHHGSITIESEVGKGTKVTIMFPQHQHNL